jgi:hypothetical protein
MEQIEADREADRPIETEPNDRRFLIGLDADGLGEAPALPPRTHPP